MLDSGSFGPIVVLFWLLNNLFFLIMSMLFVDGRVPYRKSERIKASIPCDIHDGKLVLPGVTRDISETGVSVLLEQPYYLKQDSMVRVALSWEGYYAKLYAQIVFVSKQGKYWNYSMTIKDYQDTYDE